MTTLFEKLSIIVSQCRRESSDSFFQWKKGSYICRAVLDSKTMVHEDAISPYIHNEKLNLIRMLWEVQATSKDQELFIKSVETLYRPCFDARRHLFLFLAKFVSLDLALSLLVSNFKPSTDKETSLWALLDLAAIDHRCLSESDLELIKSRISELCMDDSKSVDNEYLEALGTLIQITECVDRVQYIRLRKELTSGVNYEINQDKERLLKELSQLEFSEDLRRFLEHAEQQFQSADDRFSYKMCIDQIRSFLERLLVETATKVAAQKSDDLGAMNVDLKRPADVRKYLLDSKFLSDQFKDLINGLYKFISDEGTHTLSADKSVARIARNMIVETGLLISRRTSVFMGKQP